MSYNPTVNSDRLAGGSRIATALFDTQDAAEKARADLMDAGMLPDAITLAGQDRTDDRTDPILPEEGGFLHALKEFFVPDEDRHTFAEGLRRGGFLLSVKTDDADYDRALDILDADGAVDIEERSRTWKSEGWKMPEVVDPLSGNVPVAADASTAGFGASYAGEDGFQPLEPKAAWLTVEHDDEAESRADPALVGTGPGESGLMNPDMRERIGSGTASMTPPTPTGPQDGAVRTNAASFDRDRSQQAVIEDASLGSPTQAGRETPGSASTIGSTEEEARRLENRLPRAE